MRAIYSAIVIILFSLFALPGWSQTPAEPLTSEQAFPLHIAIDEAHQLLVEWDIAPGYFLYRDKIRFVATADSQVQLGAVIFPIGEQKHDDAHGDYETYTGTIKFSIPLMNASGGVLNLNIMYQGCAESGYCYVPVTKHLVVDSAKLVGLTDLTRELTAVKKVVQHQDYVTQLLAGHQLVFALLTFLGLGLLLSFTPCVLPMIPILSGIIVDHSRRHETSTLKAFLLSLFYVLGMALTYTVLGMVVALLGSSVQAAMQKPWVIIIFSCFFVALSLSLFGLYTLQFPGRWQRGLMRWDKHFKQGTYYGVFLMGSFSSLLVSPCVSAPLVGVLAYIGETGNVLFGASALLAMGLGMGIPLLLVGISAGKLLPRTGPWMESVQKLFGILMLGVAIWMLTRLLPGYLVVLLWAGLLLLSAILLGAFATAVNPWNRFLKALGIVLFVYGIILAISAGFKNLDPLRPWSVYYMQYNHYNPLPFTVLKSMDELDSQLAMAKTNKKPVILDFYAQWCTSCNRIDRKVFGDPLIQQALVDFVLLRADVTKNNDSDQAMLRRFQVVGPPTVIFFDREGKQISSRLVGEFNSEQFLKYVTPTGVV